jgi:hypothetical protein
MVCFPSLKSEGISPKREIVWTEGVIVLLKRTQRRNFAEARKLVRITFK